MTKKPMIFPGYSAKRGAVAAVCGARKCVGKRWSWLVLATMAQLLPAMPAHAQPSEADNSDAQAVAAEPDAAESGTQAPTMENQTGEAESQPAAQAASSDVRTVGLTIELPLFDNIDENGVDLINGYFRLQGLSLLIPLPTRRWSVSFMGNCKDRTKKWAE